MIGLTQHLRIWAYPAPCDIRKGHNGLLGGTSDAVGRPLFIFVNRGLNLTKILYFDGTGYVIL